MSRSTKHFPAATIICHDLIGKRICRQRFRRKVRLMIKEGNFDSLPYKSFEVTSSWCLGKESKVVYSFVKNILNIIWKIEKNRNFAGNFMILYFVVLLLNG